MTCLKVRARRPVVLLVDGERLEGRGVTPDVVVERERARGGPDRPRERAFEVLRELLAPAEGG